MAKKRTTDAVAILEDMHGDDYELKEMVDEATINARVAQLIYQARKEAGLSQRALAKLIGTKQPAIARLEDAEYEGHSLSMLQRIADALGKKVDLKLIEASVESR